MQNIKQLKRQRTYVFIGVVAGIGVSVAMNVLHAPDNHWARLVAAIPPLAVFAALEIIVRIPSSSLWLSVVRIFGAFTVAAGAAAISYAQQRAAVLGLHFPQWQSYFWPAIIDGLMIVTSVSLVEVVRLIRAAELEESTPVARRRAQADLVESAAALAYRRAAAERLYEPIVLPRPNGHKAAVAASPTE